MEFINVEHLENNDWSRESTINYQGCSDCGSLPGSIGCPGKVFEMQILQAHLRPPKPGTGDPAQLHLSKPSRQL